MSHHTIDYWFDFVSPYAYIAGQQIEVIAAKHNCTVNYKPMLLGAVFKSTGSAPLTLQYAPKAAYSTRDFERSADMAGVAFAGLPAGFPINSQNTARVFLWLQSVWTAQDTALGADVNTETAWRKLGDFMRGVQAAYFVRGEPINDIAWLAAHIEKMGLRSDEAVAACSSDVYKTTLKQLCENAVAAGVFGAPWMVVRPENALAEKGEAFWGNDRLSMLDWWLGKYVNQ